MNNMSENMNEKKIVTFEMFKKYHEHLMGVIEDGDGVDLKNEELIVDDIVEIEE